MTRPDPGHQQYAELAAGYALHALEPGEERRFAEHASQCPECQRALAEYAEVTAALAAATEPAEPPARLGAAIAAAVASEPQRVRPRSQAPSDLPGCAGPEAADVAPSVSATGVSAGHGARRQSTQPARRSRRAWLAAAAAVLIAAGGGTWAAVHAATGNPAAPSAACRPGEQCRQVTLTSSAGHQVAATVEVRGDGVWLVPANLRADDIAAQVYVLWQITGAHTPLAVGSFDVHAGRHGPIKIGNLAAAYHGTWAFAVSLEHGRTIPARPSHPVALGQVAS
jgi:hypothetical protein